MNKNINQIADRKYIKGMLAMSSAHDIFYLYIIQDRFYVHAARFGIDATCVHKYRLEYTVSDLVLK